MLTEVVQLGRTLGNTIGSMSFDFFLSENVTISEELSEELLSSSTQSEE